MGALIDNGSATGSPATWGGGIGKFTAAGTFGGATVTLEYLGPDGATWLSGATSLTSPGMVDFRLPPGRIRAAISGGTPSGIYARAD